MAVRVRLEQVQQPGTKAAVAFSILMVMPMILMMMIVRMLAVIVMFTSGILL